MEKVKVILSKYSSKDYNNFKSTIDMLLKNGISRGCFQDFVMLIDILSILTIIEDIVKES